MHSENLLNLRSIPKGLVVVNSTGTFTSETVPKALLNEHSTKQWGLLTVESGSVTFVEIANVEHDEILERKIDVGQTNVVVPGFVHYVKLNEDSAFHIDFYDKPETFETRVEISEKS